jgi:hypothetical protein
MAALGSAADAQTPTLVDLSASADRLHHLFTSLKPFSQSTRVNLRSLGQAAEVGKPALKAAQPVVDQLAEFSKNTPELAKNLNIVLHDLDDRGRAVEKNPKSPGGQGFTGFEALLQYVYNQALAINIFDSHGYMLKANLFVSECSDYQNRDTLMEKLKEDPDFYKRCASILGPNQQGITTPDPTAATPTAKKKTKTKKTHRKQHESNAPADTRSDERPKDEAPKAPLNLGDTIQNLLDGKLPDLGGNLPDLGNLGNTVGDAAKDPRTDLLDFLLGP